MEEFQCKTTIYSGPGAVSALAGMGGQRLMLVTDPFFMKNGTAQRIARTAKCAQVEYFDKVQPDPSVELAAEGTARLKEFAPDLLVALGGGSAMDCAKAMAYFAKGNYKLVAIPTTSGSGSEVTDFAILTHNKVKHPLVDKRLRPDAAILDSDLLQELPKGLIAETGFDALSHAVEAYAAKNAGAMTDLYAREAFSSAFAALPASYAGRKDVRLKVHQAATMAGIAFTQAGLGLCHAMAHSLGGLFHVPHGRLNAILLPSVITCNAHVAAKKYAELARAAGIGGSADTIAVRNLKNGLVRLRRELNEAVAAKHCPGPLALESEPLKVTLDAAVLGLSGTELAEKLRAAKIECEYADPRYLVLMFTPDNPPQDFERLTAAVLRIAEELAGPVTLPEETAGEFAELERGLHRRCTIRQAVFAPQEQLPAEQAVGRICAMPTVSCPPAIPIVVSGEQITPAAAAWMKRYHVEEVSVIREPQ